MSIPPSALCLKLPEMRIWVFEMCLDHVSMIQLQRSTESGWVANWDHFHNYVMLPNSSLEYPGWLARPLHVLALPGHSHTVQTAHTWTGDRRDEKPRERDKSDTFLGTRTHGLPVPHGASSPWQVLSRSSLPAAPYWPNSQTPYHQGSRL